MKTVSKFIWYSAAIALPLLLLSTHVGALLIPQAGPAYYLTISFFLTAIQVGQTAAFQATLAKGKKYTISPRIGAALSAGGAISSLAFLHFDWHAPKITIIFALGIMIGAAFSLENANLLSQGTGVRYFRNMFTRNFTVFAACVTAGRLSSASDIDAVIVAALCLHLASTARCIRRKMPATKDSPGSLTGKEARTLVTGLAAASIYRNDQNLVRTFSASSTSFGLIHNSLLAGALVQTAVGAVLTTIVLPRISHPDQLNIWTKKLDGASLSIMCIAALVGLSQQSTLTKILCASIILACNQWWSYRLHIKEQSVHVYIAGTASFFILAGLLKFGANPDSAYLLFSIATGLGIQFMRLNHR